MKKKIVVLASGNGTNFVSLREYIRKKKLKAEIVSLISDNPAANALLLAHSFGIEPISFSFPKEEREAYNQALDQKIAEYSPDLIVAAGYMKILPPFLVDKYPNRIINIHPSLLPSFKGLHAIRQAMNYGVKFTGCTTHFVDNSLDGGIIIMQSVVKIKEDMTESDLTAAVHKEEYKILPKSVHYFLDDKIKIENRKITIQE
ncbi:MAG: phosphoribosylglycinamide formyltransferase [Leptospiraceae bacterium]|nr:phosphoribosylglycinamide formyltransferase [Leptospiraceae bacterium]MCP5513223.1 phosphoribosylglycinamide formyltransferase [Leptospiraceae bacterium]